MVKLWAAGISTGLGQAASLGEQHVGQPGFHGLLQCSHLPSRLSKHSLHFGVQLYHLLASFVFLCQEHPQGSPHPRPRLHCPSSCQLKPYLLWEAFLDHPLPKEDALSSECFKAVYFLLDVLTISCFAQSPEFLCDHVLSFLGWQVSACSP